MKLDSKTPRTFRSLMCGLAALALAGSAGAQITTNVYTYNGNQTASPGTNWSGLSGVVAYWKLNGAGTAVQPTNGTSTASTTNLNVYILVSNNIVLGNGTATPLIRSPYSTPFPNIATFPGDSLILNTNTQVRFKHGGNSTLPSWVAGVPISTPTNAFPGNFGLPGIVLNGGCLNVGDSGYAFVLTGTMYANPGTVSYLNPADTFNNAWAQRGFVINSQLTGSGTIALLNATNNVPQQFGGLNNAFTGTWVVRAGWLQGVGDGTTDGYNSLGTNVACQYIVDPKWPIPNTFSNNSTFFAGPAVLELGSSLANCGGSLILTNGGQLFLHGNAIFSSVNIEGFSLPKGTYSYATLTNTFTNFNPRIFAGWPGTNANISGTLTVQNPGPPVIPPSIGAQPGSEILYPGRTAVFATGSGNGTTPLYYQWLKGGVPLANGPTGFGAVVSGATTPTLSVSGVAVADDGNYSMILSNLIGSVTSSVATLTVVTPVETYETAVSNLNPVAFYQFNESSNNISGTAQAYDYAGGFNGVYGTNVQNGFNGIAGPTATSGFPGYNSGNYAASFGTNVPGSRVTVSSWNLKSSSVTISAWINPGGAQNPNAGIVYCRGADTVVGLGYTGVSSLTTGSYDLSYNWNNDPNAYGWDSGLTAPAGQWSQVTLVVTPTNATIYVMNTNGLAYSTHTYNHVLQPFSSADLTTIGADNADGGNGTRSFYGMIDDVAVFNTALAPSQVSSLFYTGSGVSTYAPTMAIQPVSQAPYTSDTVTIAASAYGSQPMTYQWAAGTTGSGVYTNLPSGPGGNGETFSGVASATLTIQNVSAADALDFVLIASNPAGSVTSSVANLAVQAASLPLTIQMTLQEPAGDDWNTIGYWSDGLAATNSVLSEPGSTYEVVAGARLRTPNNALECSFPGSPLLVDGNGIFTNSPAVGAPSSEIRTKQGVSPYGIASVYFPLLIMNGGQFDNGNPGYIAIQGQMNIVSNTIIYVDSGGGTGRGFQLDSYLTGTNGIEYHDFDASMSGGLVVTGTSNTFTGTWNDVQGPLVGSGSNSLGTNSITVGATGGFESLYDMNSPNASLSIAAGGVMWLHQNDTFGSVVLGSTALSAGSYTAAQLTATYPKYFPTNWNPHFGGSNAPTVASGSITVLTSLGAEVLQNPTPAAISIYPSQSAAFTAVGGGNAPIYYHWQLNGSYITDSTNFIGTSSNVLTITNAIAADAGNYTVVITNSLGGVTSAPAVLTMLPTFAAENITLSTFQAAGADWNTTAMWNDGAGGLPASTSALEYPGSTYEVLAGAMLRSPVAILNYTNFPGVQLTLDGSGTWINSPAAGSAQSELRLKEGQSAEVVYFPLLVMNGGQVDNGSTFAVTLAGQIAVSNANAIFYVDSAGADGRPMQIDSWLTGTGNIEYHDFDALLTGGLNVTCSSNTYTGTWNIAQGPVLGSGANSLGTNSITVGATGVLETLYDIHSPNATLYLNGEMYLHQNDTFYQMAVNGIGVPAGVYTAGQLQSAYPSNFPPTWTVIFNSTYSAASGSITVLSTLVLPPVIGTQPPVQAEEYIGASMFLSVSSTGNPGTFQWYQNGTAISGATNSTYAFTSVAGTTTYDCTISNAAGVVTTLIETNLAVDPPVAVTFDDPQNWSIQGTGNAPGISTGILTLTDGGVNEASSAFYNVAQYVEGFDATFTYTPGGLLAADGITFCLQNSAGGITNLGGGGGNLGYFGIKNSMAVEFNLYLLATGGVGMGIGTNGSIANPYFSVSPVNLASGDAINVELYYLGGVMHITLADSTAGTSFVTNVVVGDFGSVVGDSVGYVGFTGATGGSAAIQQVSNFNFVPTSVPKLTMSNLGGGSTAVSWSAAVTTNMTLQSSASVTGPWTAVPTTPTLVANKYQVVVSPSTGTQFFRLVLH